MSINLSLNLRIYFLPGPYLVRRFRWDNFSRGTLNQACYRGVRKNVFDLRRAASIQNLEIWQRHLEPPRKKVG